MAISFFGNAYYLSGKHRQARMDGLERSIHGGFATRCVLRIRQDVSPKILQTDFNNLQH